MVDQIIIESYQNFLSKKSTCEDNQKSLKWRLKRGIGDQSFGASSHYGSDCCPPVVDSLTYIALLGFIGAATYFLQFTITMNSMAERKRSLKSEHLSIFINSVRIKILDPLPNQMLKSGQLQMSLPFCEDATSLSNCFILSPAT